MAINQVFPENYQQQLDEKAARISEQFRAFSPPSLEIFPSPVSHYRMRAEFKIWHEDGRAHYAMYQPGEYKRPFIIQDFPVGNHRINELMPKLITAVNGNDLLSRRLFQVEFLTTLTDEAVVTLIYHRPLDEQWDSSARELAQELGISLIGRSRKQKRVIGKDFVTEKLTVNDEVFHYQQVETGFTQPNARVCEKMLSWAQNHCPDTTGDLLELYCGNGNFTIPLSRRFNKVLATEISKTSVNSAHYNLELNDIQNVSIVRMSSEEFSQAMDGVRDFRRLKDIELSSYDFSTVFVDPPRAGLDGHTTDVVKGFEHIIYISCNPDTLERDLKAICETHELKHLALFDQFPYTHHAECGAILSRKG